VSTTFQIGVVTTALAFVAALAVQEIPLRRTAGAETSTAAPIGSRPDGMPAAAGTDGPLPVPRRLSGTPSTD